MTTTIIPSIPSIPAVANTSVTRTRATDFRSVPAALRSEWIKVSTLRTNKVILAVTGGVGAAIAGALAATATDIQVPASELFIYPLPLVATLAIVTGILMFTAEAQHGTLAVTLAARPARWVTVVAKTMMAVGFGGAIAGGAELGDGSAMLSRAAWALLYIAVASVIGLGVGMIVRHSAGAISGLLMWSFVIETLFAPALPESVLHFLPFSAGYRLLDAGAQFKAPVVIADELSRPMYAVIFAGYALVSLTIGTVLLYRRDSN